MIPPGAGRVAATSQLVPGQLDLVYIDQAGVVHHAWYAYLEPKPGWHLETLGGAAAPEAAIDGPLGYDGSFHFFAPAAGGGVLHLWWDRRSWYHEPIGSAPPGLH
jgi:hypothetical protein